MAFPAAFSKREIIKIPLGKRETLWFSKRDRVCVDGRPHKPTGPAFTPSVVHRVDELAKRQQFLPIIGFHRLKYRSGDRARAIRCFPHAELDESAPELPHDDFRRAHDEFRGAHYNHRGSDDDRVMAFVSRVFVPAPIAFRENAAAGGEQGDNAG